MVGGKKITLTLPLTNCIRQDGWVHCPKAMVFWIANVLKSGPIYKHLVVKITHQKQNLLGLYGICKKSQRYYILTVLVLNTVGWIEQNVTNSTK